MMKNLSNNGTIISKELHWFAKTLNLKFGVKVDAKEIGVETTELGMDEIDDAFIPKELFTIEPSTLIYEIMVVDDKNGNVWVGAISFYPNIPNWNLQVITKNEEVVFRNVLSVID